MCVGNIIYYDWELPSPQSNECLEWHGRSIRISGVARVCIPPGSHTEDENTRVTAKRRLRTISGIILRASPWWCGSLNFYFMPSPFEKKDSKTGCCRTYIWKKNRIRSAFQPRWFGFFISEESLGSFGKKREFPFFNGFRAATLGVAGRGWRERLKLMPRGYLYMENESDNICFSAKRDDFFHLRRILGFVW